MVTAALDPARARQLIGEAREDDARMTRAPWTSTQPPRLGGSVTAFIDGFDRQVAQASAEAPSAEDCPSPTLRSDGSGVRRFKANADGIARTRNNLAALADQLEAALAEIERLRGSGTIRR